MKIRCIACIACAACVLTACAPEMLLPLPERPVACRPIVPAEPPSLATLQTGDNTTHISLAATAQDGRHLAATKVSIGQKPTWIEAVATLGYVADEDDHLGVGVAKLGVTGTLAAEPTVDGVVLSWHLRLVELVRVDAGTHGSDSPCVAEGVSTGRATLGNGISIPIDFDGDHAVISIHPEP